MDWTSDEAFNWLCDGLEAVKAAQKEGTAFDASALWPPPANVFIRSVREDAEWDAIHYRLATETEQHAVPGGALQDETG